VGIFFSVTKFVASFVTKNSLISFYGCNSLANSTEIDPCCWLSFVFFVVTLVCNYYLLKILPEKQTSNASRCCHSVSSSSRSSKSSRRRSLLYMCMFSMMDWPWCCCCYLFL